MSAPPEDTAGHPPPVETLQTRLRVLLREREALRSNDAQADDLERNRREIVDVQWQLSHSLIARHHAQSHAA
jgi:hypothetical protein